MQPRRIIIVGPSGSGKSTIAEIVGRELGLPVISMDDFRVRYKVHQTVLHRGKLVRTYEAPHCWDMPAIACKLRAACQAGYGFVCEGNHLLGEPGIAAIPGTERFYLDVPFKVSIERRKTRHRHLPSDVSFALIGESETAKYVLPQKELPGVVVLDGTRSIEQLVTPILRPAVRLLSTMAV